MTLQIDLWQLVMAVGALIGAFASVVWLFGTILVRQFKAQLSERFAVIQADLVKRATGDAEVAKQLRQFEKDFSRFQIEMPVLYVRREDYIRGQTVIESKLDALYSKLEVVQIQGAKHD